MTTDIVQALREVGPMDIRSIARHVGVSAETARRKVNDLAKTNAIRFNVGKSGGGRRPAIWAIAEDSRESKLGAALYWRSNA